MGFALTAFNPSEMTYEIKIEINRQIMDAKA